MHQLSRRNVSRFTPLSHHFLQPLQILSIKIFVRHVWFYQWIQSKQKTFYWLESMNLNDNPWDHVLYGFIFTPLNWIYAKWSLRMLPLYWGHRVSGFNKSCDPSFLILSSVTQSLNVWFSVNILSIVNNNNLNFLTNSFVSFFTFCVSAIFPKVYQVTFQFIIGFTSHKHCL